MVCFKLSKTASSVLADKNIARYLTAKCSAISFSSSWPSKELTVLLFILFIFCSSVHKSRVLFVFVDSASWILLCREAFCFKHFTARWYLAQEYNSLRFRRCDERCAFGIPILLYIDKGVPVLSAGFQQSRCKFGYTTICHLPCMRIAIKTIFFVFLLHVYAQNGFGAHK